MKNKRHTFTLDEVEYIRDHYESMSATEIALRIGCTQRGVYDVAHRLGLHKSEQWISETARLRALSPNHGGRRTWFKPGHTPHSKGRKQVDYCTAEAIARSSATRFKPGNVPPNYRPIGSERINRDGYREVKIQDGLRGWVVKHRYLWEQERGPIPKDMVLIFKDGNKLNCELSNLELITKRDNIRRNSIYNYPPELRGLMRLQGRLTREIKKQQKNNE